MYIFRLVEVLSSKMYILCLSEPLFIAPEDLPAFTLDQLNNFPFLLDCELALLLLWHAVNSQACVCSSPRPVMCCPISTPLFP